MVRPYWEDVGCFDFVADSIYFSHFRERMGEGRWSALFPRKIISFWPQLHRLCHRLPPRSEQRRHHINTVVGSDTLRFSWESSRPRGKKDKGRALLRGMTSFANARCWFTSAVKCTEEENKADCLVWMQAPRFNFAGWFIAAKQHRNWFNIALDCTRPRLEPTSTMSLSGIWVQRQMIITETQIARDRLISLIKD